MPEEAAAAPSTPKLFIHEGSRQALERKLRAAYTGRAVVLSITDNLHSIISHSVQSGVLFVRIHHMFLDAPPNVRDALVGYVVQGDGDAGRIVDQYIESNGARLKKRQFHYDAKGDVHDLTVIYEDLNERYFSGNVHALIGWGRYTPRKKGSVRKTIRLGCYSHHEQSIRIHPVLDAPWVPRYFIAFVIYHEMLHHVFPADHSHVRRVLHSAEFREHEQQFTWYERAIAWETKNIRRILRAS
jgi:hypothetical protein